MAAATFTTAIADGFGIRIANATVGTDGGSYTFPTDLLSVTFHAAGPITVAVESGTPTATYTLTSNGKESIDGRVLAGRTIYFDATSDTALELFMITGTNS